MANKLKKTLAIILAVSMSMSALSYQAFATGEDEGTLPADVDPIYSEDILPDGKPNGDVTHESGKPSRDTDPETGETTVTRTDNVTWTDSTEDPETTVDDPDRQPITIEPGTVPGLSGTETPDSQTTGTSGSTNTSGSINHTNSKVYDDDGNLIGQTNTTTGSETTSQTTTTVKNDTYDDRLVEDKTSTSTDNSKEPITITPAVGEWTEGEVSDNSYTEGSVDDINWTKTETTSPDPSSSSKNIDLSSQDPLNGDGSVTLTVTPGSEVTSTKTVSIEELVNDNISIDDLYCAEPITKDVLDGDGNKIGTKTTVDTLTPITKDGVTVGYTITTTVTTIKETGEESVDQKYLTDIEDVTPSESVASDADFDMLPDEVTSGTRQATDSDGNEIAGRWVKEKNVTDDDGNVIGKVTTTIVESVDETTGKKVYTVTMVTETNTSDTQTSTPTETYAPVTSSYDITPIEPERPVAAEPYDDPVTGNHITETVTDITDATTGEVIGYAHTVTVTDKDGVVLSSDTEKLYNTTGTVTTTVNTTATSKVVTTDTHTTITETVVYSAQTQTRTVNDIYSEKQVGMEKTVDTTSQSQKITLNGTEYVFTATMGTVNFTNSTEENGGTDAIPLDNEYWETINTGGKLHLKPKGYADVTTNNDLKDDGYEYSSYYIPYTLDELKELQSKLNDGEYILVGYGAYSEYNLFDDGLKGDKKSTAEGYHDGSSDSAHSLKQFAILGKDGITYGYCVELREGIYLSDGTGVSDEREGSASTTINSDYVYTKLGLENMIGKEITIPLKGGKDALQPLNSIVKNGYTGTTSGAGSLDSVKDLLRRNGVDKIIVDSLTEGQALAATQAAIWKYGNNSGEGGADFTSLNGYLFQYYSDTYPEGSEGYKLGDTSKLAEDYANIEAVYNVLCNLAEDSTGASDVPQKLTGNELKGATIVLKDEVKNYSSSTSVSKAVKNAVSGTDNKVYNTDLSFTLAVSNSSYNGDLVVYVYAGDDLENPVATRRIAGDDSSLTAIDSAEKDTDGNTVYTISDIPLAEGTKITLKLDGTQYLSDGVYVYTCDNSQNFIGGTNSLKQDFTFTVDLEFSVDEPTASLVESTTRTEEKYEGIRIDHKDDTRTDSREILNGSGEKNTTVETETNTKVYATITVEEVTTLNTSAEREFYRFSDPAISNGPTEEENRKEEEEEKEEKEEEKEEETIIEEDVPLVDIPDMDIPLADVPKTGDMSAVWYVLSILSALGLAGLTICGKKHKEDQEA